MANTIYNPVWLSIVYRALRIVGAYDANQDPGPEQVSQASDALNSMLKSWQIEQFMWLKAFASLTLVAGQNSYLLGPGGTAQYYPADTVTIDRPTRISGLRRLMATGQEVPLGWDNGTPVSRSEWEMLPNKATTGTVVQAYYDPQLVNGILWVWPTPDTNVTDKILMTVDRPILVPTVDTDTVDLPMEWINTITFCLAEILWWEYPGNGAEYQLLAMRASTSKDNLSSFDRETASTQFGPG